MTVRPLTVRRNDKWVAGPKLQKSESLAAIVLPHEVSDIAQADQNASVCAMCQRLVTSGWRFRLRLELRRH